MGWEVVSGDALILFFSCARVPFNMGDGDLIHYDVGQFEFKVYLIIKSLY